MSLVSDEVKKLYQFANILAEHLQRDTRVKAVWLEGGLGRNTANADSDIDLHMLVTDANALRQDLQGLLEAIKPILFYYPLNSGAMSAMLMFTDQQRLEVWLEETPPQIYVGHSQILFDPQKLLHQTTKPTAEAAELKKALEECLGNFWFGTLSKTQGSKRGQLIAAMRGLSDQVDYFVTVKILEQRKFRDMGGGHYNEYISTTLRHELEAVLAMPQITAPNLVAAYKTLANLMRIHGREAAIALGATYPEKFEQLVLETLE